LALPFFLKVQKTRPEYFYQSIDLGWTWKDGRWCPFKVRVPVPFNFAPAGMRYAIRKGRDRENQPTMKYLEVCQFDDLRAGDRFLLFNGDHSPMETPNRWAVAKTNARPYAKICENNSIIEMEYV